MNPRISSLAIALAISLTTCANPASAQVVSQAKTSAGPALTTFGSETILAWSGISSESANGQTIHKVGYKLYDGAWQPQQIMPYTTINTTAAPTLATGEGEGDGFEHPYLAWRQDDGLIHFAIWDNTTQTFSTDDPTVCDGTACETPTSPALAGNDTGIFAAWTTSSGTVQYASRIGAAWTIYSVPVPGVSTKVAPALTSYNNELYLATVTADNTIQVEHTHLPLSSSGGSWTQLNSPAATTTVAPALGQGFIGSVPWKAGTELFMAWNTGSTIDFAWWDGTDWISWPPPLPIPPGPLENYSPALNDYSEGSCAATYSFNVAYTLGGTDASQIEWTPVNEVLYEAPSCPKF